ncbi:MAG: type 1 glutamine amidotransferase domain-containing protein [Spirosomataceae bacterium]
MNNIEGKLTGKKVAILATDGFERSELMSPHSALLDVGATVHIISDHGGSIRSWHNSDWNETVDVDKTVDEVNADDYDALVLPGGVINPDQLRTNEKAVSFIRDFFAQHKPVASICHGPQLLIEAAVVEGRTLTSFPSIKTDLINAGAHWEDSEVVTDNSLVTSRNPDDLPAFNAKMVEEIAEGKHEEQVASVH